MPRPRAKTKVGRETKPTAPSGVGIRRAKSSRLRRAAKRLPKASVGCCKKSPLRPVFAIAMGLGVTLPRR